MHEFEGLLFSCPASIANELGEEDAEKWAKGVLRKFENDPERINDSPETAPSKRLEDNTGYRKTTHGPNIAAEIGIDKIREQCSGFNAWLNDIEALENG